MLSMPTTEQDKEEEPFNGKQHIKTFSTASIALSHTSSDGLMVTATEGTIDQVTDGHGYTSDDDESMNLDEYIMTEDTHARPLIKAQEDMPSNDSKANALSLRLDHARDAFSSGMTTHSPTIGRRSSDRGQGIKSPMAASFLGNSVDEASQSSTDHSSKTWASTFWVVVDSPQGHPFFFNPASGLCRWTVPTGTVVLPRNPDGDWMSFYDEGNQRPYYYHTQSRTTQWEKPDGLVIPLTALQSLSRRQTKSVTTLYKQPWKILQRQNIESKRASRTSPLAGLSEDEDEGGDNPQRRRHSRSLPNSPNRARPTDFIAPLSATVMKKRISSYQASDVRQGSLADEVAVAATASTDPLTSPADCQNLSAMPSLTYSSSSESAGPDSTPVTGNTSNGYVAGLPITTENDPTFGSEDSEPIDLPVKSRGSRDSVVFLRPRPRICPIVDEHRLASIRELKTPSSAMSSRSDIGAGTSREESIGSRTKLLSGPPPVPALRANAPAPLNLSKIESMPEPILRTSRSFDLRSLSSLSEVRLVRRPRDPEKRRRQAREKAARGETAPPLPVRPAEYQLIDEETADAVIVPLDSFVKTHVLSHDLTPLPDELLPFQAFASRRMARQRSGLFHKKNGSVAQLLWHAQQAPKQSLLDLDRKYQRDAINSFKVILHICGERVKPVALSRSIVESTTSDTPQGGSSSKSHSQRLSALSTCKAYPSLSLEELTPQNQEDDYPFCQEQKWLLEVCIARPLLRDESICQLLTRLNRSAPLAYRSRAWQFLGMFLSTVAPADAELSMNLADFVRNCANKEENATLRSLAKHALRRLSAVVERGTSPRAPTVEELRRDWDAPFVGSVFGQSLPALMKSQRGSYANLELPAALVFLGQSLVRCYYQYNGLSAIQHRPSASALFSQSGSSLLAMEIRSRLDRADYILPNSSLSLLLPTLYHLFHSFLVDLPEAMVPGTFYEECLRASHRKNVRLCENLLLAMPALNRAVILFVTKALQEILDIRPGTVEAAAVREVSTLPSQTDTSTTTEEEQEASASEQPKEETRNIPVEEEDQPEEWEKDALRLAKRSRRRTKRVILEAVLDLFTPCYLRAPLVIAPSASSTLLGDESSSSAPGNSKKKVLSPRRKREAAEKRLAKRVIQEREWVQLLLTSVDCDGVDTLFRPSEVTL